MKPQQLTRLLICGLAASTFFLVNCSNSSRRSVKAQMNNKQDVIQQNFVTCSAKSLELMSQRRDLLVQISQLVAEAGIKEPDAAQKAKLQNQIEELAPLSNAIVSEIKSTKASNKKEATGCLQDVTDADKKITHKIADIRSQDLDFARKVQKITKKTNSIIEGDSKRDFNRDEEPKDENADPKNDDKGAKPSQFGKFSEGREIIIGEELAELLKSPSLIKETVIIDGKIEITDAAKAMIENPSQDGINSFCFIEATTGAFAKEDKLKVAAIREKKANQMSLVKVALVGSAEQMASLACRLNVESDFEAEISKVFANLL